MSSHKRILPAESRRRQLPPERGISNGEMEGDLIKGEGIIKENYLFSLLGKSLKLTSKIVSSFSDNTRGRGEKRILVRIKAMAERDKVVNNFIK